MSKPYGFFSESAVGKEEEVAVVVVAVVDGAGTVVVVVLVVLLSCCLLLCNTLEVLPVALPVVVTGLVEVDKEEPVTAYDTEGKEVLK